MHDLIVPYVERKRVAGRFERRYTVDDQYFEALDNQRAWLLGLLAADGYVRDQRTFSISQSADHGRKLVEHVRTMLSHQGPIYDAGNTHTLTITSPALVASLARFGIGPRKSLTLAYPDNLPERFSAAFIRGYVDGDGCSGIYQTKTTEFLLISFVGTPEFVDGCLTRIPISGARRRPIHRARNLDEIRFNGKNAVAFGVWLWADPTLPRHAKQDALDTFLATHRPRWLTYADKRRQALTLLDAGASLRQTARAVGVRVSTICEWKKEHR